MKRKQNKKISRMEPNRSSTAVCTRSKWQCEDLCECGDQLLETVVDSTFRANDRSCSYLFYCARRWVEIFKLKGLCNLQGIHSFLDINLTDNNIRAVRRMAVRLKVVRVCLLPVVIIFDLTPRTSFRQVLERHYKCCF